MMTNYHEDTQIDYLGNLFLVRTINGSQPGTKWFNWTDLVHTILRRRDLFAEMRPWQAIFNVLCAGGQEGMPSSWPEVFYSEGYPDIPDNRGHENFFKKFDIIDGYLVPKEH